MGLLDIYNLGKTAYGAYKAAPAHTGSWGTKDFSITEGLGSVLGANTTNQGGSNISSLWAQQPSSGQIQGANNELQGPPGAPSGWKPTTNPGGGSGSGGNTGLSGFVDPYAGVDRSQQSMADAELSSLNTEYDRLRSEAEGQLPYIQNERSRSLSNLANELTGVQNTVTRQKDATQQNQASQVDDAGQIARQTQRSNRNTLRALGILNSTAAGELLNKPMNEFDKVRSTIIQESTRRMGELDDFLNQKTSEHANLVAQIEDNYSKIVGDIQRDLRFNERERADSIRSVNAALSQRLSEIQQAQANWQNEIGMMKMNLQNQLGQINSYSQIQGDTSGIEAQRAGLLEQARPAQVGVVQDDKKKGLLSGLLN